MADKCPKFHCPNSSSKTMTDTPTDRKCFPDHSDRKTRKVSWFFKLLHPFNKKRKVNVIPSVQEDQGKNMSKEEYDRVLEERIKSVIDDQLRRRDDEISMLKNQVLRLKEDLDKLLSNPNVDASIWKTNNSSHLRESGDKAGGSCSNNTEQQPHFGTGFYSVVRRFQNKRKADKNKVVFHVPEFDIIGARPTPNSSAEAHGDQYNKISSR